MRVYPLHHADGAVRMVQRMGRTALPSFPSLIHYPPPLPFALPVIADLQKICNNSDKTSITNRLAAFQHRAHLQKAATTSAGARSPDPRDGAPERGSHVRRHRSSASGDGAGRARDRRGWGIKGMGHFKTRTPCTYSKLTVSFLLLPEWPSFPCLSCFMPLSNIQARETRCSFCFSCVTVLLTVAAICSFCFSCVTVLLTVAAISARHMLPDRGRWGRLLLHFLVALLLPGAVPGASALVSSYKYVIKAIIIFSRNSGDTALRDAHFGLTNPCCPRCK